MNPHLALILGGARSGKSRHALQLAHRFGDEVTWIATAEAFDDEMAQRIQKHRQERPNAWHTVEAPFDLAHAINQETADGRCVVVDCLTLWLSNWLCRDMPDVFDRERALLLKSIEKTSGPLVLVSNEVGWGIVPDNALSRRFRDEAGRLHQDIAAIAQRVTLVVAGIAMPLKE